MLRVTFSFRSMLQRSTTGSHLLVAGLRLEAAERAPPAAQPPACRIFQANRRQADEAQKAGEEGNTCWWLSSMWRLGARLPQLSFQPHRMRLQALQCGSSSASEALPFELHSVFVETCTPFMFVETSQAAVLVICTSPASSQQLNVGSQIVRLGPRNCGANLLCNQIVSASNCKRM